MGDFVRVRNHAEPVSSFEQWVTSGMEWGEARRGAQWAPAFAAGDAYAFVYRTKQRGAPVVAGVIKPSHDAVGRKFPMVIATPIAERQLASAPHLAPLVLGDFLTEACEGAIHASAITTLSDFENHVTRINAPRFDWIEHFGTEYTQWRDQTRLGDAWIATFGVGANTAAVPHAMATIVDAIAPFRGQESPTTPLSLKLPLGSGGVAAAAFWIDVVRSAAGWRATMPTVFWSSDGLRGNILIQLGDTPPGSLAELWAADPESDHVCDLTGPKTVDPTRILARMSPRLAGVLQSATATVAEMLQAF